MTDYIVIYEQGDDGGWGAYSPDFEGCVALGASREEVERNMREGILLHVEELRRRGQPIPKSRNFAGVISV
jgi:predicted RNase H-like HicB family nuclease